MERQAACGSRPVFTGRCPPALLGVLVFLVLGLAGLPARSAGTGLVGTLQQAQTLLSAGRARDAWLLLAPLELEAGGSPYFDYLYGLAALDTGRQADAIPALERVLAREPDFAGARMELARARFELGDYPAARVQFEYLLTQSPPPATRAVIDRYLLAMDEGFVPPASARSRFLPYVEIGTGWDSNANASTDSNTFGPVVLDSNNVETDSTFVELAGGFQHGLVTEPDGVVISVGRASYRLNPEARFVDQALVSLGTAGQKSWGQTRATLGASGYYSWLDGSPQALSAGLDLGLARQLGPNWELASVARVGGLRYQQDDLKILDVDRYLGTLSVVRAGLGTAGGRMGVSALFGTDSATQNDSPYGNDRLGGRVFAGWPLGSRSSLFLDAGYLVSDYDSPPDFFGENRKDRQWTAALSTEYRDWPARGYSLVPTLRFTNTDSTVSLYEYDRLDVGVFLRRSRR